MNKSIGLAVIYDPHNIYQFLWYYCTYGKDMQWNALCLPNSYKGEYLSKSCEKLGIFNSVYRDDKPFDALPFSKKIKIFIKMFFYAIFGQQKQFCEKTIARYINGLEFDEAVVLTDVGFLSGMFLTLGKEKKIVILEDGMGDYLERKFSNIITHITNFFDVQGFLLSVLGYSNIGHCFPLRTTKNCIKYCSHPDKMRYKSYKEMYKLFDTTNTDVEMLKYLLNLIYPNLNSIFCKKWDAILFTTPLTDYVANAQTYISEIEKYVKSNIKNILIKKHPRDKAEYDFGKNVTVCEIEQSIPAEILLPYLTNIDIYFCEHSSINLYASGFNYTPSFFYFNGLREENLREKNILCQYKSKELFLKDLSFFEISSKVIDL